MRFIYKGNTHRHIIKKNIYIYIHISLQACMQESPELRAAPKRSSIPLSDESTSESKNSRPSSGRGEGGRRGI